MAYKVYFGVVKLAPGEEHELGIKSVVSCSTWPTTLSTLDEVMSVIHNRLLPDCTPYQYEDYFTLPSSVGSAIKFPGINIFMVWYDEI